MTGSQLQGTYRLQGGREGQKRALSGEGVSLLAPVPPFKGVETPTGFGRPELVAGSWDRHAPTGNLDHVLAFARAVPQSLGGLRIRAGSL